MLRETGSLQTLLIQLLPLLRSPIHGFIIGFDKLERCKCPGDLKVRDRLHLFPGSSILE